MDDKASEAVRREAASTLRRQRYRAEDAILLDLARRGEAVYPDLKDRPSPEHLPLE